MHPLHLVDLQAGYTPLYWGCVKGHREVALLLLDRGAEVNACSEVRP